MSKCMPISLPMTMIFRWGNSAGDSSKTLIVLNKGDIFGEMAIIEKKRRSASAVAVMKTKLLVLNEKLFDATIEGNPDFARKMIKIFSERLRKTNATLQEVLASNHQNQVLAGLVQYASEHGITTFKGRRIHIEHFVEWASGHIGITEKEIRPIIQDFLKREVLTPSARSSEEVLFQPR